MRSWTLLGPQSQKWHVDYFDNNPSGLTHVIQRFPLENSEADLQLHELAMLYPLSLPASS